MMKRSQIVCQNQKLDRDPSLGQIPIGRYGVVVDGVNLSSTITEDARGISLCPSYSAKQLRRIERIAKKKADLLTAGSYLRSHSKGGTLE
jgi:hypothetical protein